jgi:hypothetical protein
MVTGIVDHTRDRPRRGTCPAPEPGSGTVGKTYADWLKDRGTEFTAGSGPQGWIPSAATPTRSATSCPKPSPSWTHFMS